MPDLTSRLIVELIDRVSGPAGKASKSLKGIADSSKLKGFGKGADEINRLTFALKKAEAEAKKLSNFRVAFKGFQEARSNFRRAQEDVHRLAKALQEARKAGDNFSGGVKGIRDLERRLNTARNTVHRFSRDFKSQTEIVKSAARSIGGVSFDSLKAKEANLKRVIDQTNASLREQVKLAGSAGSAEGPAASPGRVRPAAGKGRSGQRVGMGTLVRGAAAMAGGYGVLDAMRYVYDFEFFKNKMEGRGGWSRPEVEAFAKYARETSVKSRLGSTSGPAGMAAIGEIYAKAGLSMAGAKGALLPTLRFGRFGDISDEDAAESIVRSATAFGLPLNSVDSAQKNSTRIADIMSYIANETIANVDDVAQGYKFAAPLAHALGQSPEQLGAYIGTMLQHGISGPEAGVAMRSALVRTIKPTKPARAAMAELGLNFGDFATGYRDFTPDEFYNMMVSQLGSMKKGTKGRIAATMEKNSGADAGTLRNALLDLMIKETGSKSPQDKTEVNDAIGSYLESQIEDYDFDSFMEALRSKKATAGHFARIFDQRQASRLLAVRDPELYNTLLNGAMNIAPGAAERGSTKMMQGLPGDFSMFMSSLQDFAINVGDSGVLGSAATALRDFSGAIQETTSAIETAKKSLGINSSVDDYVKKNGPFARDGGVAGRAGTWVNETVRGWMSSGATPQTRGNEGVFMDPMDSYNQSLEAGGGQAKSTATSIASALMQILGITVAPVVDTSSLAKALGMVNQLKDSLAGLQGSMSSVRGLHADTGGGGW